MFRKLFKKNKEKSWPAQEVGQKQLDESSSQLSSDSARSYFFPQYLISTEDGILILCTKGIHAFLLLEYLTANEQENIFCRAFQRMDFGPLNLAHVLIGKGVLKLQTATTIHDSEAMERMQDDIKVGPHWEVKVTKVTALFDSVYNGYLNGELSLLYSLPGDSSQSSMPSKTKEVNNCLTFSRNFLFKHGERMGLDEDDLSCINGWTNWIPAQSPVPIVLHYKNKQKHNVDI